MGYKVNFENVQSVTIPDDEVVQLFADGVTSEYNFAKNDQRVINNAKELVFVINRDYVNSTSVENVSLYTRFKAGDIVSIELPNGVELYVPWKETPDSIDCNGLQEQWLANNYFLEDVDDNNLIIYIGKEEDKPSFLSNPFGIDDEAAEILNLPIKVDKLKKFGARFTDPHYVGIIIGNPSSTNVDSDDGGLEFDQPEYSKDEDDDGWDDNWGSL